VTLIKDLWYLQSSSKNLPLNPVSVIANETSGGKEKKKAAVILSGANSFPESY